MTDDTQARRGGRHGDRRGHRTILCLLGIANALAIVPVIQDCLQYREQQRLARAASHEGHLVTLAQGFGGSLLPRAMVGAYVGEHFAGMPCKVIVDLPGQEDPATKAVLAAFAKGVAGRLAITPVDWGTLASGFGQPGGPSGPPSPTGGVPDAALGDEGRVAFESQMHRDKALLGEALCYLANEPLVVYLSGVPLETASLRYLADPGSNTRLVLLWSAGWWRIDGELSALVRAGRLVLCCPRPPRLVPDLDEYLRISRKVGQLGGEALDLPLDTLWADFRVLYLMIDASALAGEGGASLVRQ